MAVLMAAVVALLGMEVVTHQLLVRVQAVL
jgi:hypothetical protein